MRKLQTYANLWLATLATISILTLEIVALHYNFNGVSLCAAMAAMGGILGTALSSQALHSLPSKSRASPNGEDLNPLENDTE